MGEDVAPAEGVGDVPIAEDVVGLLPLPGLLNGRAAVEEAPVQALLVVGVVQLVDDLRYPDVGVVVDLRQELKVDVPVQHHHRRQDLLRQRRVRIQLREKEQIGVGRIFVLGAMLETVFFTYDATK